MSVANGELADANNINTALVSREVDSSMAGVIGLLNAAPTSGPTIANIQRAINQSQVVTSLTQSLNAGGQIAINDLNMTQKVRVQGNAGAVALSNTPFGNAGTWPDGMRVRVQGMNVSNTVTISNQDIAFGVLLRDGSVTLKLYDIIELEWDSVLQRFLEINRNF